MVEYPESALEDRAESDLSRTIHALERTLSTCFVRVPILRMTSGSPGE